MADCMGASIGGLLNDEIRDLLFRLTERWIAELETNKAELDVTMPKDLQPMMEEQINIAINIARDALVVIAAIKTLEEDGWRMYDP